MRFVHPSNISYSRNHTVVKTPYGDVTYKLNILGSTVRNLVVKTPYGAYNKHLKIPGISAMVLYRRTHEYLGRIRLG